VVVHYLSPRIEVENFPAFVVIDDKGNDFFKELNLG
jgi:tartrate dehydratase beta subunit/fumarate hydratase class I family protein